MWTNCTLKYVTEPLSGPQAVVTLVAVVAVVAAVAVVAVKKRYNILYVYI